MAWQNITVMLFSPLHRLRHLFMRIAETPSSKRSQNSVNWKWTSIPQTAYDTQKVRLISSPVLGFSEIQYCLEVDLLYTGLGAVLLQEQPSGNQGIVCTSQGLWKAEHNMSYFGIGLSYISNQVLFYPFPLHLIVLEKTALTYLTFSQIFEFWQSSFIYCFQFLLSS